MARRCKSYEEQIEALNQQISKAQDKLDSLVLQREELLEKKKQEDLQELYTLIKNNNLTISDIEKLVQECVVLQKSA